MIRTLLSKLHLVLGLTVGLLFVATGLTGSALVFYPELDTVLNPSVRSTPATRPESWQAIYDALRRAHPERPEMWRIEAPESWGPVSGRSLGPAERDGTAFAPLIAWVDPRDNRVVRSATWGESGYLMTWIYDLHYRLRLGATGALVMAVVGIFVLCLLATGLVIWWPGLRRLPRSLRLPRRALPVRAQLFAMHTVVGAVTAVVLLPIVVTGVMMSVPEYVRPILARGFALEQTRVPPPATTGQPRIPVDAAVRAAEARFPEARIRWIETPDGPAGAFRITLYQAGEPSRRFPQTTVWVDQYSAQVTAVRDPRQAGAGDVILNWLHGLHKGEAFGLTGRIVALASGFVPLILFVTGVWYWWRPTPPSPRSWAQVELYVECPVDAAELTRRRGR